ncbi:MAG: hypothetical protein Greene041662_650 [Candidatus Peregrinibacteria bacterium Greene0416_62]|nr:MAG: hypothetical protein Greene041662_650 [Candidatus Peregrinibacteria bacterium Greene0416_62]TSC97012.1 MAG: hypothetical protein Greene101449_1336 [Candidatus Peregrinibacteria bacterium Greene1014_49]
MMSSFGPDYGFIVLWAVHVLSVIASFTGLFFLIVFAVKTLTPKQLKTWAIWLMVTGAVVCLITIALLGRPWMGFSSGKMGMEGRMMERGMMMERMMDEMTEHDQGANGEEGEEHGDMMQMMRMMMNMGGSTEMGNGMMQQ